MRLAFLILAHRLPEQLERLTTYLAENDCDVFVHIDTKSSKIFENYRKLFESNNRVHIHSRYKIHWGGYSQIRATMFLLQEAVRHSDFLFVSLISGQDVPIKPLTELRKFLDGHRGRSFLGHNPMPIPGFGQNGWLDRVQLYWITNFPDPLGFFFNRLNVLIHTAQHKFGIYHNPKTGFHAGPNWFTLSREMAVYTVDLLSRSPKVLRRYKNTRCADEIIMQTILLNSPYKDQIVNNCLREIDWHTGPEFPRVFRVVDLPKLKASPHFFARKFDAGIDNEVINELYKSL
jgi:hypothetical protein